MSKDNPAAYGRGGDNTIGHLTTGELVVPTPVLNEPGIREHLMAAFDRMGVDFDRYMVGGEDDSVNPQTGYREFFGPGDSFDPDSDGRGDHAGGFNDGGSGGTEAPTGGDYTGPGPGELGQQPGRSFTSENARDSTGVDSRDTPTGGDQPTTRDPIGQNIQWEGPRHEGVSSIIGHIDAGGTFNQFAQPIDPSAPWRTVARGLPWDWNLGSIAAAGIGFLAGSPFAGLAGASPRRRYGPEAAAYNIEQMQQGRPHFDPTTGVWTSDSFWEGANPRNWFPGPGQPTDTLDNPTGDDPVYERRTGTGSGEPQKPPEEPDTNAATERTHDSLRRRHEERSAEIIQQHENRMAQIIAALETKLNNKEDNTVMVQALQRNQRTPISDLLEVTPL